MKPMTVAEFVESVKPGQALVMRGAPGSGKSTVVEALRDELARRTPRGRVFVASADAHRMVDGAYVFDASKNDQAHGGCLRDFITHADQADECCVTEMERDVLVCDNTNVNVQEIAPYYAVARAFGWEPLVVNVQIDPEVAARRNQHGVPANHVHRMADRIARFNLPGNYRQVTVQTTDGPDQG